MANKKFFISISIGILITIVIVLIYLISKRKNISKFSTVNLPTSYIIYEIYPYSQITATGSELYNVKTNPFTLDSNNSANVNWLGGSATLVWKFTSIIFNGTEYPLTSDGKFSMSGHNYVFTSWGKFLSDLEIWNMCNQNQSEYVIYKDKLNTMPRVVTNSFNLDSNSSAIINWQGNPNVKLVWTMNSISLNEFKYDLDRTGTIFMINGSKYVFTSWNRFLSDLGIYGMC